MTLQSHLRSLILTPIESTRWLTFRQRNQTNRTVVRPSNFRNHYIRRTATIHEYTDELAMNLRIFRTRQDIRHYLNKYTNIQTLARFHSIRNPACIATLPTPITFVYFLLLARCVPNEAKRSVWDQCKKKYILRTDRPTTDLSFGKKFKWPYLREWSSDPLHVWFYGGVFGVGGSNGAISGLTKFNR